MAIITDIHSWEYTKDDENSPWYGVAFNYADKSAEPWVAISEWCYEQFGYPQKIHEPQSECEWSDGLRFGEVAFRDPRFVPIFILRWS